MHVEEKNGRVSEQPLYFYLEQDIRGTKIFLYGVTGLGLLVALRRIRPFSRFVKPSDIPDHFIKSKVRINANVARVEPSAEGPLLMAETIPLVPLPRFGRSKQLPIKIANIDVTANGISWLQTVASGKKIVFVPLAKNKESVECRVSLVQSKEESLEVGKELVRLGFGMVRESGTIESQSKDKQALAYRESLIAAQKWAIRHRNGHWHHAIQPTLLWKLKSAFFSRAKALLPVFVTRQLNI